MATVATSTNNNIETIGSIKVLSSAKPTDKEITEYVEVYNSFASFKKLQATSEELLKQINKPMKQIYLIKQLSI